MTLTTRKFSRTFYRHHYTVARKNKPAERDAVDCSNLCFYSFVRIGSFKQAYDMLHMNVTVCNKNYTCIKTSKQRVRLKTGRI